MNIRMLKKVKAPNHQQRKLNVPIEMKGRLRVMQTFLEAPIKAEATKEGFISKVQREMNTYMLHHQGDILHQGI